MPVPNATETCERCATNLQSQKGVQIYWSQQTILDITFHHSDLHPISLYDCLKHTTAAWSRFKMSFPQSWRSRGFQERMYVCFARRVRWLHRRRGIPEVSHAGGSAWYAMDGVQFSVSTLLVEPHRGWFGSIGKPVSSLQLCKNGGYLNRGTSFRPSSWQSWRCV